MDTKINKVTVYIDTEELDGARISLYKTNTKYGELTNADIDVPDYSYSKLPNKMVYAQYCKDITINLLQNGGIEGFYYEEKQSVNAKKYNSTSLEAESKRIVLDILGNMASDKITYELDKSILTDTHINVIDRYKDGNIKDGVAEVNVIVRKGDNSTNIIVPVHIKSGQMCKPKIMAHNGEEVGFNITKILSILK